MKTNVQIQSDYRVPGIDDVLEYPQDAARTGDIPTLIAAFTFALTQASAYRANEVYDRVMAGTYHGYVKPNDPKSALAFASITAKSFAIDRKGRKYIRIVGIDSHGDGFSGVHCFVDNATGDIYKSAGWTGPAKGARFNLVREWDLVMWVLSQPDAEFGGWLYADANASLRKRYQEETLVADLS